MTEKRHGLKKTRTRLNCNHTDFVIVFYLSTLGSQQFKLSPFDIRKLLKRLLQIIDSDLFVKWWSVLSVSVRWDCLSWCKSKSNFSLNDTFMQLFLVFCKVGGHLTHPDPPPGMWGPLFSCFFFCQNLHVFFYFHLIFDLFTPICAFFPAFFTTFPLFFFFCQWPLSHFPGFLFNLLRRAYITQCHYGYSKLE